MKPSFALNLTEDGITLLHRTPRGWMDVGNVAFDNPDLGAALDYLRSTALGLSPTDLTTKLIIPESQILYLQVEAVGPDDASRRSQIEAALEGRTPYALDELVYDWTGSGPVVTVAVVARETLAEAEGFATEHRFNPVSFVARPESGFEKEPFFGVSKLAPGLLPPEDAVEPDDAPVTIIARERPTTEAVVPEDLAPEDVSPADLATNAPPNSAAQVAEPPMPAPEAAQPDLPPPDMPRPDLPAPDLPAPDMPGTPVPVTPPPAVPEPEVQDPDPPPGSAPEPDLPPPFPGPDAPPESPVGDPQPGMALADPEPASAPPPLAAPAAPVQASAVPPAPAPPHPVHDPVRAPAKPSASSLTNAAEAEAPMAIDVQPEEPIGESPKAPAPRAASVLSGQVPQDEDLPPLPSAAAMMAFSSRRPADGAPRPLGAADTVRSAELSVAKSAAPAVARPAQAKPNVERPAAARPPPKFSYDDPLPPPPPRMPGDPPPPPAATVGKASKSLRNFGTLVTAPSIPGTRTKKASLNGASSSGAGTVKSAMAPAFTSGATLAAPIGATPVTASAKAAAKTLSRQAPVSPDAIARGLSARSTMTQRGKPRYLGLILTGVLLLLLALVAAWSSFYLTRASDPADAAQIAGVDDEAIADGEAIGDGEVPDAAQAFLAEQQDPADLPVNVDLTDLAVPDVAPEAMAVAEVVADVVATPAPVVPEPAPQTGVQDVAATATQPDPADQDEIFLAGMDAPPSLSDPLVLSPPADEGDAPPAAQMPPPPFGTVYQFDADGRIMPTAEGILTPEGVLLVAGKPARVPPPRPATLETVAENITAALAIAVAPAADAPAQGAVVADAEVSPADTFAADPTLSAARPRVRPEGLAPEAASAEDDASLAPAKDSRFASLRPRLRPAAILAAGEASRRASKAASLAVQTAVAEAAAASAADASISPMAVSVSRVPAPRPRDLSRAVEAAVAAATRRPEPEVIAAAAPAPATKAAPKAVAPVEDHEAEDEPEVAAKSTAPRIPTKANVAKQATFVNAINLGKLNLIGVYGTQSKRYALVRQPNGRFRKVRVGDTLDGGRVQAITASEVRYQKSGRMLALAMPKG